MRARLVFLILGSAALGGCAYGYGGYGSHYGGVSVGVGYGSGYGGYGYGYGGHGGYCSPYSYGYGSHYGCIDPYWGWYGGYYYPGTGFYVYDRFRRPFRWNDRQRRYWMQRRHRAQTVSGQANIAVPSQTFRPNWEDFNRERGADRGQRREQSGVNRSRRGEQIQRQEQVQTGPQNIRPDNVRPERPARTERPARNVREGASERRSDRRSERRGRRTVDE
jgi:hypothetical protein